MLLRSPQTQLAGKRVLVAGASRGIGLAIAEAVAAQGAETFLAARSSTLKGTADRLHATPLHLDLADHASIVETIATVQAIDVLINVAGTNLRKQFQDYTASEIQGMFQTNLFGPMQLTQGIGAEMIRRGRGGKIINIGSLTTLIGLPFLSIYGATKGAVGQWTKSLAAEWGRYDIQVNCIAPGFILTDLNRQVWEQPEMVSWLAATQPNPRTGRPEEIASLAVYLASSESSYITGQIFAVDGGHSTSSLWPFDPSR